MSVITAIAESPRRAGRFEILVDGKPLAAVSVETIGRLKLTVGRDVDEPLRAELEREGAALRTLDRAMNLLAFRARSASELRRSLLRKGEEAAHVDSALERLRVAGLVDDSEFARQFARSKVAGQGFSRRRLERELFRKGVERAAADEAISEALDDESVDEGAMIERAARKKLRTLARLDPAVRRRRLYGYLARRGYESDDIRRVMRTVLDGGADEEGGEEEGSVEG